MSALTRRDRFGLAALPSFEQLRLHVDAERFLALANHEPRNTALAERLAPLVHERYRELKRRKFARRDHSRDPSMRPWGKLAPHLKESNRCFVDDIPRKLRMIGCCIGEPRDDRAPVEKLSEFEIQKLAPIEHQRYDSERLSNHWRLGDRDPLGKASPYLRAWSALDDEAKEYDIDAVRGIPDYLKAAGRAIYRVLDPE